MSELTPRTHDDGRSRLVAYDHGAHLASWEVDGAPVVWLSPRAVLDGSAAIRGGVPLCLPWFANGPDGTLRPSHGPARTTTWRLAPTRGPDEVWAWTLAAADLAGSPGAEHLPGPFEARYAVSLTASPGAPSPTLGLLLEVRNTGDRKYRLEGALHTYLAVPDATTAEVDGLDGAAYLDKVTGERHVQHGPVRLDGETDNVYDSPGRTGLVLRDGNTGSGRRVQLAPVGSTQTVVWNPGPERSAAMEDLGPEAWRSFVCVEAAATGDHGPTLAPGATWALGCRFTVHPAT